MALLHELIGNELVDHAFLKRFTNAPQLVVLDDCEREGLFAFDPERGPPGDGRHPHNKLVWDKASGSVKPAYPEGIADGCDPALEGHYTLDDGTRVAPSFQLLRERVALCTPEWAQGITGIDAARIRKLAREMGETALKQAFEMPIPWTDAWGKKHPTTQARPVAFHAMRGLAAHSNGFQTVRALAVLMSVLGTIDAPGGFRHKAPYPRHIVPNYRAFNDPGMIQPNTPLNAAPLGFPANPEELAINPDGSPIRIDHAFSWEHPLSAHGLMHNVITNAVKGDPYRIDTLMIFMANMAWNSSMNTMGVREMLNRKDEKGEHMIPFLVVCDAFQSETVAFADLVLPDTTYLERHDVMGMLDRPISEFDGPVDSVRVPVVPPTGECKPFQEVLIELASRLKFPAFTTPEGGRKYTGTRTSSSTSSRSRASVFSWAGAARTAPSTCAARRIRSSGRPMQRTTACSSTTCPRPCTTCATGTGSTWTSRKTRAGASATIRFNWRCTPTRCRASASRRRARARGGSRPMRCASASTPTSIRCRSGIRRSRRPQPTWRPIRSTRSRSGRWRCTTRGTRRTRGSGRSTATTTCM
jgi:anaerobic selenocysteine-containing dehydrogenase